MTGVLRKTQSHLGPLLILCFCLGCPAATEPEALHPEPTLRRLTVEQYTRSIEDIFGPAVVVPTSLEPDVELDGFFAVGAAQSSLSSRGIEQYESAALALGGQLVANQSLRDRLIPCTPSEPTDQDCFGQVLAPLGRSLWRRPLTTEELDRLVSLGAGAAATLGSFDEGLVYAVAALLTSPHFLYRVELGEANPDRPSEHLLTAFELASRLSFTLWNTTPDTQLLDAAARGELDDESGLARQAERLLQSPRLKEGVRNFFTEAWELHSLDDLALDPLLFNHMGPEVGPAAREETLLVLESIVWGAHSDLREILTTRNTFLNRKLASIYGLPAPAREGFAELVLPEDGARQGLLGQVSFLAMTSHPVSTSSTLRGKFVREKLLCELIEPPLADIDTSIPEPSGTAPTLRDRIGEHLSDPACAGCHEPLDGIGLALENFDAIGRFRKQDNGATIDPSGMLDGTEFTDPTELAQLLKDDGRFTDCLVRQFFRYTMGHLEEGGEEELLAWLGRRFEDAGYDLRDLLYDLVTSRAFRRAGSIAQAAPLQEPHAGELP